MRPTGMRALVAPVALLLAGAAWAEEAKPDFAAEMKALNEGYQAAEAKFWEPWRKAKTDKEREALGAPDMAKHPVAEYLPKYQDLAKRAAGTDTGLLATLRVATVGGQSNTPAGKKAAAEAVDAAVRDYIDSPRMDSLAQFLRYGSWSVGPAKAEGALKTLIEKSPHRGVKAAAMASLGAMWSDSEEAGPEKKAEALKMFRTLVKEYADVPAARVAKGFINELENLQVGKVAPDFEATDSSGKKFRLSDYRGKVLALDFWGFW